MKYFYSHIIEFDNLHQALEEAGFEDHERKELVLIVEDSIFHIVLDTVLTELSEEDKKKFLTHLHEENHEKIWAHLKDKVGDIEEKISKAAGEFLKKLHEDIKNI